MNNQDLVRALTEIRESMRDQALAARFVDHEGNSYAIESVHLVRHIDTRVAPTGGSNPGGSDKTYIELRGIPVTS